jgi:hypothetical protein
VKADAEKGLDMVATMQNKAEDEETEIRAKVVASSH